MPIILCIKVYIPFMIDSNFIFTVHAICAPSQNSYSVLHKITLNVKEKTMPWNVCLFPLFISLLNELILKCRNNFFPFTIYTSNLFISIPWCVNMSIKSLRYVELQPNRHKFKKSRFLGPHILIDCSAKLKPAYKKWQKINHEEKSPNNLVNWL